MNDELRVRLADMADFARPSRWHSIRRWRWKRRGLYISAEALRQGLIGEHEPLKSFGVVLDETEGL